MQHDAEFVTVGKIGSPYGIKGWLKIVSYTDSIADILTYKPWYLGDGKNWSPVKINAGQEHGKGIIAHLEGINNPEQARLFVGKLIAIKHSQLPVLKKDEYYWSDLEGLTVINQNGESLGTVAYMMETGSNDVIVVKGEKEHAIPYLTGSVVTNIDLDKKILHVNWDVI